MALPRVKAALGAGTQPDPMQAVQLSQLATLIANLRTVLQTLLSKPLWIRTVPPDQQVFADIVLDDNEWHKLIDFQLPIAMWTIENRGSQNVEFAMEEKKLNPARLTPNQIRIYETSPRTIWVHRTSTASSPEIHLEYWYWSPTAAEKVK